MNLGFKEEINGTPTFFVEKIWESLLPQTTAVIAVTAHILANESYKRKFGRNWDGYRGGFKPKHHTIRSDKKDKWKAGNLIHAIINNRTPKRFQFAPLFNCVSTQSIEINFLEVVDPFEGNLFQIKVDGEPLNIAECTRLAENDGFDSLSDFLKYFKEGFSGKIIHWTNLKY